MTSNLIFFLQGHTTFEIDISNWK